MSEHREPITTRTYAVFAYNAIIFTLSIIGGVFGIGCTIALGFYALRHFTQDLTPVQIGLYALLVGLGFFGFCFHILWVWEWTKTGARMAVRWFYTDNMRKSDYGEKK